MYVSIVVYVDVEVLHEEKIKELKKSISDNTVEQRVRSEEMKKVLAQHEHYQKELNELQQYIDATYARQKALEHDYLSLDDAIIRLNGEIASSFRASED